MRFICAVVAFVFALACASAPASATIFPAIGGAGDGPFTDECPQGEYLVGLSGRAGAWIDQIILICAAYQADGTLGAKDYRNRTPHGGMGGIAQEYYCPKDNVATGMKFDFTEDRRQIWQIAMRCNSVKTGQESGFLFGPADIEAAELDDDDVGETQYCPDGEVATGINGRSGKHVNAIGLICKEAPAGMATAGGQIGKSAQALETAPAPAPAVPPMQMPTNTYGGGAILFAVDKDGVLEQYEDRIQNGYHLLWFTARVDTGWDEFTNVVTALWDGETLVALGLTPDGDLLWRRIDNVLSGPPSVTKAPSRIGNGWSNSHVFSTGQGVLYSVNENGELIWHRLAQAATNPPSYSQWAPANRIGWGWSDTVQLFSPGEGIIYVVKPDGALMWYQHTSYLTGEGLDQGGGHWAEPPHQIGSGWTGFKQLAITDEGRIYALRENGELMAYHHLGWRTGEYNWEDPPQMLVNNWANKLYFFAATGAAPYQGPN